MSFGPKITAGGVTLRPAVDADLLGRQSLGVNAEISRMFGATAPRDRAMTHDEATRWYSNLGAEGTVEWIVEHDGTFLGSTRLHRFEPERKRARFAIGFFVRSTLGRGIGTAVTRLVLRYGFDELGLAEIELVVLDFNERARRCYRACGFREVARIPSDVMDAGRLADDVLMAVTPAEFSAGFAPDSVLPMTEPLIASFEEVWGDIVEVCADLTDAQWEKPTDCPGWTVKDNVAHMIGTERMLLGEQPDAPPVDEAAHVKNDIGKVNEQWIAGYRAQSGKEVLDAFRAITGRRLEQLRAMSEDEWNLEGFTPEGPGPYRQFMAIRVFDCWFHDQDIREAVDRPGFLEGPVADLSLGRIPPKGLPYVVGKKAGAPPETTVVFNVEGAPPFTATVLVPPEGRARLLDAAPTTPSVTLDMDRRTFARLAGGRWTGEQARTDGVVRVDGDRELGNRIVDNMAFTL